MSVPPPGPLGRLKPFVAGVGATIGVVASALTVYVFVSSANAPSFASVSDLHIEATTLDPELQRFVLPAGSELPDLQLGCTDAALAKLSSEGRTNDPTIQVTLTNTFHDKSTGQIYVDDIHAKVLSTSTPVTASTLDVCPSQGAEFAMPLQIDLDKRVHALTPDGDGGIAPSGDPAFELTPGETISFDVTLSATRRDFVVQLEGTMHSGGTSTTIELTRHPIAVASASGAIVRLVAQEEAPRLYLAYPQPDDEAAPTPYAVLETAPATRDDITAHIVPDP
jgi:hypothetical protein